jgi:uncharacterized protein (DUF983 family)
MSLIIFQCRDCESEICIRPETSGQIAVCPACGKSQPVRTTPALSDLKRVDTCVACGYDEFYVQKDFNRRLGMGIVVVGILCSTYFFNHRQPFNAMASLVVTAMVDLLIYSLVGTVTVCYSCHAVYRGFEKNPVHEPFDLKKLEKYGGRTPRFGA